MGKAKAATAALKKFNLFNPSEYVAGEIEKQRPNKAPISSSEKEYWKKEILLKKMQDELRNGKQTVGPTGFVPNPMKTFSIGKKMAYNEGIDKWDEDLMKTPAWKKYIAQAEKTQDVKNSPEYAKYQQKAMDWLKADDEWQKNWDNAQQYIGMAKMERDALRKDIAKRVNDFVDGYRDKYGLDMNTWPEGVKEEFAAGVTKLKEPIDIKNDEIDEIEKATEQAFLAKYGKRPVAPTNFYQKEADELDYLGEDLLGGDGKNWGGLEDWSINWKENANLPPGSFHEPSNQKFITRYHVTDESNVPGILKNGLDPDHDASGGFAEHATGLTSRDDYRGAYTMTVPPWSDRAPYTGHGRREVALEFMIPKEEYYKLNRRQHNTETKHGQLATFDDDRRWGRTDVFQNALKPEWLTSIYKYTWGRPEGKDPWDVTRKDHYNLMNFKDFLEEQ